MPNFNIEGGWTVGNGWGLQSYSGGNPVTAGLVMNLDAATLSANPTTWTDSVSNLAFTLYGSPTYSSANGGVLQFATASSQYAQSPNPSFGTLTTFTVEVWHYYTGTNTGSSPCIITEVFTGGSINYFLGSGTTTGVQAGFFNGQFHATSGYAPTASNWYQLVDTYDGATVKLYVNGTLTYSTSYTGTPSSGGSGVRLMRRWDNAEYWGGSLGIVRIYNGALTPTQIATNYNANKTRFGLT